MATLLAFVLFYGLAFGLYRLVPQRLYAGLPVWLLYPVCFGLFVLLPYTGLILLAHAFPALTLPIDRPALAALLVLPVYWFVRDRAVHGVTEQPVLPKKRMTGQTPTQTTDPRNWS